LSIRRNLQADGAAKRAFQLVVQILAAHDCGALRNRHVFARSGIGAETLPRRDRPYRWRAAADIRPKLSRKQMRSERPGDAAAGIVAGLGLEGDGSWRPRIAAECSAEARRSDAWHLAVEIEAGKSPQGQCRQPFAGNVRFQIGDERHRVSVGGCRARARDDAQGALANVASTERCMAPGKSRPSRPVRRGAGRPPSVQPCDRPGAGVFHPVARSGAGSGG